jgi:hypothetical protein
MTDMRRRCREKRRERGDVMANDHRDPMVRFWMTRVSKQISRRTLGRKQKVLGELGVSLLVLNRYQCS